MSSRRRGCIRGARIEKNIMLPLEIMGFDRAEQERRVKDVCNSWIWKGSARSFPGSCRAACSSAPPSPARSPSTPTMLLMDEPFGALDEIVRDHLNEQLLALWARTEKTIGFVTHSIPEAVYLSTKIVVMSPRPGRITDVIESDLPAERPLDIRDTPEFLAIAHRVREGLRAGHAYDD
jgi:NitT/TauT family transport system ATP-binding protein